jgi:pimeloyl-ACP methyl ester carboxylesterase
MRTAQLSSGEEKRLDLDGETIAAYIPQLTSIYDRREIPLSTQLLPPTELILDVSAALPFAEPVHLASTVYLPDSEPRAVLVCWPGGGYGRVYWDMHIPGRPDYSFAEHLTAQGFIVVAADHLGVGDSSKPADGDAVNFETMGAAAAAFVDQVRERLAQGVPVIGLGHSLGACLTVVAQARHACYDAVALLGFTHGQKDLAVEAVGGAAREGAAQQARAFFGDGWDDVYGVPPREPNHPWLYFSDVPAAVIEADDATAAVWPRQAYVEALLSGYSARFAAELEGNVFIGFGDHDVPPAPHEDVAFYPRSRDVTLYVLRDSAHCHNFASTRTELWDRIGVWAGQQTNR